MNFESEFLLTLGGILLLGLVTDMMGRKTVLPRITLLLIFGILIGPHVLNLIPENFSNHFDIIADMTLLIVGFLIGGKLAEEYLKRSIGKVMVNIRRCGGGYLCHCFYRAHFGRRSP